MKFYDLKLHIFIFSSVIFFISIILLIIRNFFSILDFILYLAIFNFASNMVIYSYAFVLYYYAKKPFEKLGLLK